MQCVRLKERQQYQQLIQQYTMGQGSVASGVKTGGDTAAKPEESLTQHQRGARLVCIPVLSSSSSYSSHSSFSHSPSLLLSSFCCFVVVYFYCFLFFFFFSFFSSPEPKARVSYCRPFSSVVRRASSVNFLHFHLLLENAWLDFNQTWQESSLGVGDSKLFK